MSPISSLPELTHHTDQQLLEAMRHDNEAAFVELFKRHWRKVHAMAFARVRSKAVTEEIVQELFMALWDKRATQSIKHLSSYLYQAVKFKALNQIRVSLMQKKYWEYYRDHFPQEEEATQKAVEYRDLLDAIEQGINTLPEKSKQVFTMNRLEGHSVPEIADLLNLSEKTIEYHLSQSVKKLRVHLKNYIFHLAILISVLGK